MKKLSAINQKLIKAAQNNQPDELKNLLDQGADIHTNNDEALILSARCGNLEVVKFLVTQGANIHANDDEALRWSADNGHIEIVKFLITNGANIHINDDEIFKTATKNENEPILMLLNTFLIEEKLLVAASDYMLQKLSSVESAPKTKRPSITKAKRSKI